MQRNLKYALFFLFIVAFFQAGGWTSVYAGVIDEQVDDGFEFNINATPSYPRLVNLGTNLSGQVYKITFKVRADASNFTCQLGDNVQIVEYTDGTYTTSTGGIMSFYCGSGSPTVTNVKTVLEFLLRTDTPALTTIYTFDSTKYYRMSNNGAFGSVNNNFYGDGSNIPYYVIEDTDSQFPTSRIVTEVSPVTSPTATPLVTFEYDYYNTGYELFDKAGVEIQDLTAGFTYTPIEENVNLTGYATYQEDYLLTEGHAHIWRAYLRNSASSTQPRLYGRTIGLIDVVTASASSTPYIEAGATTTSFFDFLNIPQLLKTKKPTGYFFEMASILQNLDEATSTTPGILQYDFSTYASGTSLATVGAVTLFGTSTVKQLIPDSALALFNALITAILYVGAGMHIYHKVLKHA